MNEKARFRKEFIGFKKNDVYDFIEGLYKNFDEQLKKKDEEIETINREVNRLRHDNEILQDKLNGVDDYKANIADVMLKAKEQGEEIVKEAVEQADAKRREIERLADGEAQKLEAFKDELRLLLHGATDVLGKYRNELENLTEESNKV